MQEEEEAQRIEKERQIELAFKKSPVIPNFSLNCNPEQPKAIVDVFELSSN